MDAARDAGPIAVCGNSYAEPTESCDDGNVEDGDGCSARCRYEPFCGDGQLDPGEVCDDGNGSIGDGCDPTCASDETCGNGIVDHTLGESCDDPGEPSVCDASCSRPRCGDGALDAEEACDDGNREDLDGCGGDCRPETSVVLDRFEIAPVGTGCDFTGDGYADNSFAQWMRAGRVPLSTYFTAMFGDGSIQLLLLFGLDDATGQNDERVALAFAEGWDVADDDPTNNLIEGARLQVLDSFVPSPRRPRWALPGAIVDGALEAGPATALLRLPWAARPPDLCDLDVHAMAVPLARARFQATVEWAADRVTGIRDGVLCGAYPLPTMVRTANPLADLQTVRPCDPSVERPTLADLVLGGGSVLDIRLAAVRPDVDLDGDGLESFELATGVGCQPVVSACIDGDGTRFEGHDCVLREEFADGISSAFGLSGPAVSVVGIQREAELAAPSCE